MRGADSHHSSTPPGNCWSTPACAGRTSRGSMFVTAAPEHPRVRGADLSTDTGGGLVGGAPPRARGGQARRIPPGGVERSTPACAGRTLVRVAVMRTPPEHPRVRGADSARYGSHVGASGAPPRARGGQPAAGQRLGVLRSTPACAGRTAVAARSVPAGPEHPRVRGADVVRSPKSTFIFGAPPRARGGRRHPVDHGRRRRSTPACAGRTRWECSASCPRSEHPRVRGADATIAAHWSRTGGAPPRARGGLADLAVSAGHRRSTPACAGRTAPGRSPTAPLPEHPRVRGADSGSSVSSVIAAGAPPRARGGHFASWGFMRGLAVLGR